MTDVLPDPRPVSTRPVPTLLAHLTDSWSAAHEAGDDGQAMEDLVERMRACLGRGEDASLHEVLSWDGAPGPSRLARVALQRAVDAPVDAPVRLQLFALPVIIIAGASRPDTVQTVLRNAGAILEVFRAAGSLGPSRHIAFSTALCDESALLALSPSQLYRQLRLESEMSGDVQLPLPEAPLALAAGQSAHLRFLTGTCLQTAGAPGFTETAGDAGRWGAAFTRELAGQLAHPGVTLLPLGRAPRGLYAAVSEGRFCREEIAFQLGVGESLRQIRSRVGDPQVTLQSKHDGSLEVTLSSPWEPALAVHRWRVFPDDDMRRVSDSLMGFLRECGLTNIQLAGEAAARRN